MKENNLLHKGMGVGGLYQAPKDFPQRTRTDCNYHYTELTSSNQIEGETDGGQDKNKEEIAVFRLQPSFEPGDKQTILCRFDAMQ